MKRQKWLKLVAFMLVLSIGIVYAASAFAKYETIPYGEQSTAVRKMQDKLKQKGYYDGNVDGKFGPATKKAVVRFQKSIGITADGKPGNKTLTALYEGSSAINTANSTSTKEALQTKNPRTLSYGSTGSRVRALQKALADVDCYKGSIDGTYGDLTVAAVKKFQYKNGGLRADGIAGPKTLDALNKKSSVKVSESFLLTIGSEGKEVKDVIAFLGKKGYGVPTGSTFNATLEAAVKAWQEATGKTVTGTITESQYNRIVLGKEN